jgi:hypothetical protein
MGDIVIAKDLDDKFSVAADANLVEHGFQMILHGVRRDSCVPGDLYG